MNQIGRNLSDAVDGLLHGKATSSLIAIRCLRAELLSLLGEAGVASVNSSAQSQLERANGTVGTDDQGIVFGADLVGQERGAKSDC